MSDNNNHYTDDAFSHYPAIINTLLIAVESTAFSYAVVHNKHLLATGQNCPLDEMVSPNQHADLLTATYNEVIVGLAATGLTLVPKSIFNLEHVADFARLLDVKETEKVFVNALDDQNVIIYKTSAAMAAAADRFGAKNVIYTATGWVKVIAQSSPPNSNLYLNIGKDSVQFLYFWMDRLRFYNTFEFKNSDELVYFTAFVAEELNLKSLNTTLVLSGEVSSGDNNITRLTDFFPKIELNGLKPLDLPSNITSNKILALAALSLCASSVAR